MKCWEMILIVSITMGIIMQLTILAPFMPLEIKRRSIPQIYTGAIMGASSVGVLLAPIMTTKFIIPRFGNRLTSQIASVWLSVSVFAYGLQYFIPDHQKVLFVTLSILTRVSEGSAISVAAVAFFSLLITLYSEEKARALSLRSLGIGAGLVGGLGLGGIAYQYLGYFGVFAVMCTIPMANAMLMFLLKAPDQEKSKTSEQLLQKKRSPLTECDVLKERRTAMALLNNFFGQFFILFLDPIISLKLSQEFGFSKPQISLFIMIFFGARMAGSLFALCLPQKCEKRFLIIVGDILMIIGLILVGPSRLLHFPNRYQIMAVGLAFGGFGRTFQSVHGLGEAVEAMNRVHPEWKSKVSDLVNSVQVISIGVAFFIGPLSSSALYQAIGFRSTFDVLLFIHLINLIIFGTCASMDFLKEKKRRQFKAREINTSALQ